MRYLLFLCAAPLALLADAVRFPWVVYYDDKALPELFTEYNPIVFETISHPPLEFLLGKKKEVLGYLNVAESSEWEGDFAQRKAQGLLLQENPLIKGSWSVDLRDPVWKKSLLQEKIPSILGQGFTGLFLDQIDVALMLEKQDAKKYAGMRDAAVDLVRSIRRAFPNIRIMMNRGFEILEQVGEAIDYELAETLYTAYNEKTKSYFVRSTEEYAWQMGQLNAARAQFPHLVIFSLDYWDPADVVMLKKIYSVERGACLRPYVSTLSLDKIVPEPP
jgi:uncharacterized protein (TIGR01370 family)